MKPHEQNIDDVLKHALPSAPRGQMEAALERVHARLQSDAHPRLSAPETRSRAASSWRPVIRVAAAAAVVVAAIWGAATFRDQGVYAVLEAADGSIYRIAGGNHVPIHVGDRIAAQEIVRSDGAAGAVLALADGSHVEMRSMSELSWDHAADGLTIRLDTGSIIVSTPARTGGRLYVETKDVTVSTGKTFLVNAAAEGSHVAAIEGDVQVHEGKGSIETKLRPGEQVSTNSALVSRPVTEEIKWSRNVGPYLAILATFNKGMAETAGPLRPVRTAASYLEAVQNAPSTAGPQFEEASIRPCDPDNVPPAPAGARGGGANSLQMTPGRLHALCLTLATLIRTAYNFSPADLAFVIPAGRGRGMQFNPVYGLGVEDGRRVKGGPDWVRSEHYTIDAVADGAVDAETMRTTLLRALLESRFKLRAHVETEEIPAFALVVAPGGLKMKEGTCTPAAQPVSPSGVVVTNTADMVRKNLAAARRGETTVSPCGYYGALNGPNMLFVGAGTGVPRVGNFSGAPVLDRTGVPNTARFNYVLEYAVDNTTEPGRELPPGLQIAADPSSVPRAPSLVTALEEQLGLKLEPAKAPREFIVVDRVERLSPN